MRKLLALHNSTVPNPESLIDDIITNNEMVDDVILYSYQNGVYGFMVSINNRVYLKYKLMNIPTEINFTWITGILKVNINELHDIN